MSWLVVECFGMDWWTDGLIVIENIETSLKATHYIRDDVAMIIQLSCCNDYSVIMLQ